MEKEKIVQKMYADMTLRGLTENTKEPHGTSARQFLEYAEKPVAESDEWSMNYFQNPRTQKEKRMLGIPFR